MKTLSEEVVHLFLIGLALIMFFIIFMSCIYANHKENVLEIQAKMQNPCYCESVCSKKEQEK